MIVKRWNRMLCIFIIFSQLVYAADLETEILDLDEDRSIVLSDESSKRPSSLVTMTAETEDGTWECRRVDASSRAIVPAGSEDPSVALTTFVEKAGSTATELGNRLIRNENEVCVRIDGNSKLVYGWMIIVSLLCAVLVGIFVYFVFNRSTKTSTVNANNAVHTINQLVITKKELGRGSHGTVVFAGRLGVRHVAVKRMLKEYFSEAGREISLLIRCDKHPNVLRYFAMETEGPFIFLALELCEMSLADAIETQRKKRKRGVTGVRVTKGVRELMRGLVSGVKYLHDSYIVHRDIKPQNVLLQRRRSVTLLSGDDEDNDWAKDYVAKLSDMGLGKQLRQQRSSWRGGGTVGTAGWQAPEVLRAMLEEDEEEEDTKQRNENVTNQFDHLGRAVDVWSMGCVLHTTACLGQHPFGKWYEREKRILERRFEAPVSDLAEVPELRALIRNMISSDPIRRPNCESILDHPFFWTSERKLRFLVNLSDRASSAKAGTSSIQNKNDKDLISELERFVSIVLEGDDWISKLPKCLLVDLENRRRYSSRSVVDCLRMIRNRANHFRELTTEAQSMLSPFPESFVEYFVGSGGLFPKLLLHCFEVSENKRSSVMIENQRYRPPNKSNNVSIKSNNDRKGARYKTKMCTFAGNPSSCPQGSACRYAHDESELAVSSFKNNGDGGSSNSGKKKLETSRNFERNSSGTSSSNGSTTSPRPGVRNERYKTSLCRAWETTGSCRFSSRCIFAHGVEELREESNDDNEDE